MTGWIAVQRDVMINFNLEQYSLNIKTDSTLGSDDEVVVELFTSQGDWAGALLLHFTSTPQYEIWPCKSGFTNFPTNLPPGKDKIWRVTLNRTSGIRLVIHCNEEEVLNMLMSASTCDDSEWREFLNIKIATIMFSSLDNATDFIMKIVR